MPELAAFQDAFLRALRDPTTDAGPGMAVYRNTVAKSLTEVLRASFPTVERIVGDAWFGAAALAYAYGEPPASPVLADYGGGFPRFLRGFPPAAELPYLADMAAIDRLWTEAHLAPDAPPLDAAALAGLPPEILAEGRLRLHASARFDWFATPAASLWRLNRPPAPLPGPGGFELDWRPEGIALARPEGGVRAVPLGPGAFALLAACGEGRGLDQALAQGLAAEPPMDVQAVLTDLTAAGLFGGFDPSPMREEIGA